jgi:hypothetical protein
MYEPYPASDDFYVQPPHSVEGYKDMIVAR